MNYNTRGRINHHQRHKINSRPGLLSNFIYVPNGILINPFYLVNLSYNNVLMDLTNLVTLPINQKIKNNEHFVTITPLSLYFFLSPQIYLNRNTMDNFYR
ncbi:hypothetical protein PVAND_012352 [Polypedilum vanderplanki]|uniref:Uncharacterized protein n=1 Tax=Polypedilum vanderplanki TaxID=319348 RepID=A0A9J6CM57_POLVA|nr:hypothetical protein PVAND_012352 [Polypedilum vanderplanki]